jgi:hypothetical protein
MADDGLTRTLKDLFAGAVGGVAQVLIGQPFGKFISDFAQPYESPSQT